MNDVDSPAWTSLVDQCRSEIAQLGCLTLRDFLRPPARVAAAAEIAELAAMVPIRHEMSTVYARTDLEAHLDVDDPRRMAFRRGAGHVTRDMIGPHTVVHRLYASPQFKAFVRGCVGVETIFEYADPLAGLIATVVPPDSELTWHYDTNEFVVTLMTQRSDAGGQLLLRPEPAYTGRREPRGPRRSPSRPRPSGDPRHRSASRRPADLPRPVLAAQGRPRWWARPTATSRCSATPTAPA